MRDPSSIRLPIALISFLIASELSIPATARAIPADKLSHFAGGVASGAIATVVVDQFAPEYRLVGGVLLGTVPGLIIEIVDSTNDAGFSGTDLLADFIGSATGALILSDCPTRRRSTASTCSIPRFRRAARCCSVTTTRSRSSTEIGSRSSGCGRRSNRSCCATGAAAQRRWTARRSTC
jgi:VanZ family protein